MKFNIISDNKLLNGFKELSKEFDFELDKDGLPIEFIESENNDVKYYDDKYHVFYNKTVYAYRGFFHVLARYKINRNSDYNMEFNSKIDNLTFMQDCSRNAVMKVSELKRLIRYLAVMGYNSFMLYTEDTYKVDKYPYFGYLRNPYTKEDLKEIDNYCDVFGIELIPCIQTLAHFNEITRYYSMEDLFDCNDILLIGSEKVYEFIEELIKTCSECFKSRKIHIGMDEAHMVGRGRYLDINGYKERGELMNYHVKRVLDICKKYNLNAMMWSDMYVSYVANTKPNQEEDLKKIPKDIELIYWDYYHTNVEYFENWLNIHKKLGVKVGFAGGAWKWLGFTPDNRYSNLEIYASMKACMNTDTSNYILTGWGDNGAETSVYGVLPALYFASLVRFGYLDLDKDVTNHVFNDEFKILSDGLSFNDFMNIDLANRITHNNDFMEKNTANKYLLFNDPLLGTIDTIIDDKIESMYSEHINTYNKMNYKGTKFEYIFNTQYKLFKVLEKKSYLGVKLRTNYQSHNLDGLKDNLNDLKELLPLLDDLYNTFKYQWDKENRVNGFDVQDIRFGALEKRIKVAIKKLTDYLNNDTDEISELNEKLLCFMGHDLDFEKDYDNCEYRWRRLSSVNVND